MISIFYSGADTLRKKWLGSDLHVYSWKTTEEGCIADLRDDEEEEENI